MKIVQKSSFYILKSEQIINLSISKVWDFFSVPDNLNELTPKGFDFEIQYHRGNTSYAGQLIIYKIEVFPFVKTTWMTEITQSVNREYFIDEQKFGPYAFWHHEHFFKEIDDKSVLMTDHLIYKLPFGILGRILAGRIIKNKIKSIFKFRFDKVNELFKN